MHLCHAGLRNAVCATLPAFSLLFLTHDAAARAQATPGRGDVSSTASTNGDGPAGMVPFTKGFNSSVGVAGQHDSAAGWSSTITPDIAWRFDSHFSVNISIPIYDYVITSKVPKGGTVAVAKIQKHVLGDTTIDGEFEAHPALFDYTLSTTVGAPTGDSSDGLGTGKWTYAFNNRFEHSLADWVTPALELGIGDNPNLNNTRVRKSYADDGMSAHFQFGFDIAVPFGADFETDAYEDLPIGSQTVTSATTKGKKGRQTATTTTPPGAGEDNGFLNTLDIPLTPHIKLSGFYNRSLRLHDDTVGVSLTFLLRAAPTAADNH